MEALKFILMVILILMIFGIFIPAMGYIALDVWTDLIKEIKKRRP